MNRTTSVCLAVLAGAAIAAGTFFALTARRPGRAAVSVNGRIMTEGELDLRAETLLEERIRTAHLAVPESRRKDALERCRRQAAKGWILLQVMLEHAVQRGLEVTPEDERECTAKNAE